MFTCVICKFETETDDIVGKPTGMDNVLCARCYYREVDPGRRIGRKFRLEITAALNQG